MSMQELFSRGERAEIRKPLDPTSTVGVHCGPGRTRQSARDECDINVIMARYAKSGVVTHVRRGDPMFLDVSEIGDFRSLVERVEHARSVFAKLPATTRAAFGNSPVAFLEAVADPARAEELVALGVLKGSEEPSGEGTPEGSSDGPS